MGEKHKTTFDCSAFQLFGFWVNIYTQSFCFAVPIRTDAPYTVYICSRMRLQQILGCHRAKELQFSFAEPIFLHFVATLLLLNCFHSRRSLFLSIEKIIIICTQINILYIHNSAFEESLILFLLACFFSHSFAIFLFLCSV